MSEIQTQCNDGLGNSSKCAEPVDLVHLARFTLGDQELEREVLGLFLEQAPVYLEKLRLAGSDRDWHEAAHTMKGSAFAVGAWRVADCAAHAERLASVHDSGSRGQAIIQLGTALDEANAYISGLFEDA